MIGEQYSVMSIEYIDGLVQERHNSIANTLELWLSCTSHWYDEHFSRHSYSVANVRDSEVTKSVLYVTVTGRSHVVWSWMVMRCDVRDGKDNDHAYIHNTWGIIM